MQVCASLQPGEGDCLGKVGVEVEGDEEGAVEGVFEGVVEGVQWTHWSSTGEL